MDTAMMTAGACGVPDDVVALKAELALVRSLNRNLQQQADMLARRCAEQAHTIADLLKRKPLNVDAMITRIRQQADEDGALHFDALRRILSEAA